MPSLRVHRALIVCLLLLLMGACTDKGLGNETRGTNVDPALGRDVEVLAPSARHVVPQFQGPTLDGSYISSSSLRGHIVVVNFWASWCGPCRSEQAALEKSFEEYKAKGVRFVGINFREPDKAAARAYLDQFHVKYPSIWDPDSSLAQPFHIFAPPSTFVLDPQGRIASTIIGATTSDRDLNVVIDRVLLS
ncbi:MAG: TlpA disulfide reductase family protein [Actinomycetota bacterium]